MEQHPQNNILKTKSVPSHQMPAPLNFSEVVICVPILYIKGFRGLHYLCIHNSPRLGLYMLIEQCVCQAAMVLD